MPFNPLARRLASLALAAALSLVAFTGCGDDEPSAGCGIDRDCPTGRICVESQCTAQACGGNGDCLNGDQACITTATGSFCSAVECGCANCGPCGDGESCENGSCVAETTCDPITSPCAGTDVCDAGACRPCAGAECPASDCTVSGCTGSQVCNTTTKVCEDPTTEVAGCTSCVNEDQCPGDARCVPLATGNACLLACSTNNDCETGFECGNQLCAPAEGRCEGCLVNGCGAGLACNPTGATCVQVVAACGACTDDWQCGADAACRDGKCSERCDGTTCGSGGTCVASNGIMVCEDACQTECPTPCTGPTPVCASGVCVECNNNGHCTGGQTCNTSTHACEGTLSCSAPTPVEWQGTCVQCTSNNDCNGQFCNIETHTCTSSQCASCVQPYPACVTIGDDSYCVQCDPADTEMLVERCGQGATCNESTYACEGGTVTPTVECHQDSDCVGGEAGGFDLKCDVATGYCYDADGFCDDVTAYCPGTDGQVYECKSFFEAFGGGGAAPPDTGGGTIPGFCGCGCDIPGVCIGPGTCQTGNCANFGALFGMPSSEPFCFAFE